MIEKLNQEIAILLHRVTTLEKVPPRVSHLEQEMAGVKKEIHLARREIGEVKTEVHHNGMLVGKVESRINQLFWTGAGVALTISAIAAGTAIINNLISSGFFH